MAAEAAPEITDIEVGAGGYAPHPHCDVAALLASAPAPGPAGWTRSPGMGCGWTR